MRKNVEIYRLTDWRKKKYYIFLGEKDGHYEVIRDCGWGAVSNGWIANDDPIVFISGLVHAINIKTSTGVHEIKRVYYKNLPKIIKDLFNKD